MDIVTSIISWTFTAVLGVSVLGGVFAVCRNLTQRKPIPPFIWSSLAQLALFFAAAVLFLLRHGHYSRTVQILSLAGCVAAWPRLWQELKAERNQRAV